MARRLEVEIIGDSRSLERALGRSQKATGSFGRSLKNAAKTAAFGIAGLTVAGTVLGKKMIDLASDAAEVESKFRVVFGKQMPRMVDELDSFSKATGASRFELREQAADMGALLKPLSESTKAAGDMSIQFVKLATDLSSFNNVPVEDALLAIRSGLVGESEPLRRFGVLLNESAVKAEGLRMGLIKGKEEMTEQQKVLARSNLIMQQTTLAQGDAERTAGSFANQMRALTNGLRDTGTEIGLVLLPHVLKLVSFLNDNMPTIKNVMKSALEGITFAIEHGIVPAVQKAALVFREIAEAAREHWPKVRTAAESVANWYRANLQPTFESVSRNLVRIWDRMGSDLQNTTKGHLTRLPPLVQAQLGNIASVATAGLAILRGDWSTAWNELKEIPIRTFRSLVQTIKSLVGTVYQAAMAVGAAVVDGIKAGISSAWGSLTSWVGEKMADLKDAITHPWRIGSPSKVTIEIGQRIAEGLGVGFGLGMVTVTQEAADKINQAIDNMVRAVQDRRGALGEAMSELVSQALGAFDELTSQFETKAERQIRVTEERRAKADRIRRRDEAQAALNTAIAAGDPEAEAEARRELEDAKWEITRAGLEREAEAQRRAFEERRELRRRHFEEELATLQKRMEAGRVTQEEGQKQLLKLFAKYDIPFRRASATLGKALTEGLLDAFSEVRNALRLLAQEVEEQLDIVIRVERKSRHDRDGKGKQHGGPVFPGVTYPVGERRMELFTPSEGGRIWPRVPAAAMVGGGGQAGTLVSHIHVMLDGRQIYEAMQRQSLQYEMRNGTTGLSRA